MSPSKFAGLPLSSLPTPCFVVDRSVVMSNCSGMLARASQLGVQLRTHVKTHKTVEAAKMQTGGTRRCLVTSTMAETEMLAAAGFDDVLYAYPLSAAHMERNAQMMARMEKYHVMAHDQEAVRVLMDHAPPEGKKWRVSLLAATKSEILRTAGDISIESPIYRIYILYIEYIYI